MERERGHTRHSPSPLSPFSLPLYHFLSPFLFTDDWPLIRPLHFCRGPPLGGLLRWSWHRPPLPHRRAPESVEGRAGPVRKKKRGRAFFLQLACVSRFVCVCIVSMRARMCVCAWPACYFDRRTVRVQSKHLRTYFVFHSPPLSAPFMIRCAHLLL